MVQVATISTLLSVGLFIALPLFRGEFSVFYLMVAIANWLLCFFAGVWFTRRWRRLSERWNQDSGKRNRKADRDR